jgi:hypothetical protein
VLPVGLTKMDGSYLYWGTIKVLNNRKQISFLEDLHVNSRRKTYFGAIRIECYSKFSPYVTRPSSLGLRPLIKSEELF